jgi:hypothetical protein
MRQSRVGSCESVHAHVLCRDGEARHPVGGAGPALPKLSLRELAPVASVRRPDHADANPPSIGNTDTIGHRTALYFLMIALVLLVVVGGSIAVRHLAVRFATWDGALLAIGGGVLVIGLAYALFPAIHETPDGFPADALWKFRIASCGIRVAVWSSIGFLFGVLAEGSLKPNTTAVTG